VEAVVDLAPFIAQGKVFTAMQDPDYFTRRMRVTEDRLGLEWPGNVDFSADGLRFMAFPQEEAEEFRSASAETNQAASPSAV
jgi:hypothetical protein